jgi:hypothetical protein
MLVTNRMAEIKWCTCCRHYPGAAAGHPLRSSHPTVSAFPETTIGSAHTSSFSRLAQRSLALRPAHSRRHQIATAIRVLQTFRRLHACPGCFRLERLPGGACTCWKAPPFHGARGWQTLECCARNDRFATINSRSKGANADCLAWGWSDHAFDSDELHCRRASSSIQSPQPGRAAGTLSERSPPALGRCALSALRRRRRRRRPLCQ